jgi:N-acetylmuramoyl-L-alanine amidase
MRIGVEVNAAPGDAPPPVTAAVPPPPVVPFANRPVLQTIVLDPGHGGQDAGVRAANGTVEKDLTLALARRIRALIETRLGVRVVLTRDDDRPASLDERAAVANNNKADLFLSFHFNAAPSTAPGGAEVLSFRLDDSDEVQRAARGPSVILPVVGGLNRPVDVVSWDLAQARHVHESAAFAGILVEELGPHVPLSVHGRRQAPLRVLSSVNMPAALIEMAYLTNPAQEQLARSESYQSSVAQAVYNAVLRFRSHLEERRTP